MILFGYKSGSMTARLYPDGTLLYGTKERLLSLYLPEPYLSEIRSILKENRKILRRCGSRINSESDIRGENCFIFEDYYIIDWDLTRWYLEEDRKKHPEYYSSSVKLELTETYIRSVFDEICLIIEKAEKIVRYSQLRMIL